MMTSTLSTDTLSVELTVKEAQALSSGVKFVADPNVSKEARQKLIRSLDRKLFPATSKTIHYHELEV
ncbi:hypothetical protein HZF08_34715 [Paenibacillus sp. CGMCC 1.16610]|uniref:Uncharacterized protein n=1 Tax=Paenibacillus anseongense TaxID=2682845 RepID=A0ABW9U6G4_9BACL|nr:MULTISPECIES: hypothetical protein [Paenibacillus]MBA2943426.1 hypothetical protein [Paenibacillus sp. CGMCC 1.16610]MVQ33925.1 hypothetical protein [Paenibacillus anseongense]